MSAWNLAGLEVQCAHSLFEGDDFLVRECIGLGDDRDEVDLGVQSTHDLDVERLE